MTTPHPQHAADTLGDGLGFPGVPEDAPEELDGPPERREEALTPASEENAAAGRLAYAVHADQLVSTRGRRVSALQPSLDEATVALIQAALSLTSSLRVPDALRRLVESACSITGASWGTIAVLNHADMDVDPAGPLSPDPSGASSGTGLCSGVPTATLDELAQMAGAPDTTGASHGSSESLLSGLEGTGMVIDNDLGRTSAFTGTIEGEETELDRTVIDEIGDPIMHLLRNSLDHGVESPDAREAKGKPRVGEVGLIARHEGNNVVIMITDDGAGIDASKIRRKAVEKGMITQDEADRLDDADAVRLIFLPGFSTAEQITDISGRGVGMDVVRSKIEALSGHVDVETHIDEGSIFKIKLPLTLAIIQAMLVRVQEEMYAIPLTSIDSTVNIEPTDIQTIQNKEVIVLRGEIIPIVRMEEALQVPHVKDSEELFVVVVHAGEAKAGIVVDNLIGQQEIVIKTLGNLFAGLKLFGGATVLGDGRVALILDVATMIQQ